MNILFLVLGFILLFKGSDYFVDGSSSIAKSFNIPPIIIGLTIVSFGTSAPEASVSITASMIGNSELALGNILGSNIFNLLIVIGMSSIMQTLTMPKGVLKKEFPFLIFISFLLIILFTNAFTSKINVITKLDGIILFLLFFILMWFLIKFYGKSNSNLSYNRNYISIDDYDVDCRINSLVNERHKQSSTVKATILILLGIISFVLGGKIVVDCATNIASSYSVSNRLLGLTIIAISTSLPEFVTTIIAAIKGESGIAIGNIIGSNIFNLLFTLGISSIINPIFISKNFFIDSIFMILAVFITFFFSVRKKNLDLTEGIILMLFYVFYILHLLAT